MFYFFNFIIEHKIHLEPKYIIIRNSGSKKSQLKIEENINKCISLKKLNIEIHYYDQEHKEKGQDIND